jgi:hypothetical protein
MLRSGSTGENMAVHWKLHKDKRIEFELAEQQYFIEKYSEGIWVEPVGGMFSVDLAHLNDLNRLCNEFAELLDGRITEEELREKYESKIR